MVFLDNIGLAISANLSGQPRIPYVHTPTGSAPRVLHDDTPCTTIGLDLIKITRGYGFSQSSPHARVTPTLSLAQGAMHLHSLKGPRISHARSRCYAPSLAEGGMHLIPTRSRCYAPPLAQGSRPLRGLVLYHIWDERWRRSAYGGCGSVSPLPWQPSPVSVLAKLLVTETR